MDTPMNLLLTLISLLTVLPLDPVPYARVGGASKDLGQASASATQQSPPPKPDDAIKGEYTINAQDILNVQVFDEPELSTKYRVEADGMITFPLLGRVPASGLTLREFQDRLRSGLSAGYIRNPQVRVDIESYKSQSVYVIGEVRSPGKISIAGSMSLIEALALAGSPTVAASNELIVVHPKKAKPGAATLPDEDADAERTRVNIKDLQVGKAGLDISLKDGDTIFVPKAQQIYITGQVRNPGSYVLDPGMTLLQALALAGGITDRGSDRRVKIIRIVNNKRLEVDAKMTDTIQPNDTIEVGQRFF
jgi:polysaccharide export outer membrane protein